MAADLDALESFARSRIELREETDGIVDRGVTILPEDLLRLIAELRTARGVLRDISDMRRWHRDRGQVASDASIDLLVARGLGEHGQETTA